MSSRSVGFVDTLSRKVSFRHQRTTDENTTGVKSAQWICTMRRLKIAFIWESEGARAIFPFWNDGYKAALDIVARKHDIDYYLGSFDELNVPKNKYDVLMYWGSSGDKYHQKMVARPERKLWLYPGGGINPELPKHYNVVFTEDKVYEDALRNLGSRVIRVTGSNTRLFKPEKRTKLFGAFYPATFSMWKRQDLFARAVGPEGLCSGTVQPDGGDCLKECEIRGTKTIIGYLPAELLAVLYNMSEVVILPVVHGSQRTLLEALGMNIPVVVSDRFKPTIDLANEVGGCEISSLDPADLRRAWLKLRGKKINTRPYVIKHYGEKQFAEKLLKGIEE